MDSVHAQGIKRGVAHRCIKSMFSCCSSNALLYARIWRGLQPGSEQSLVVRVNKAEPKLHGIVVSYCQTPNLQRGREGEDRKGGSFQHCDAE